MGREEGKKVIDIREGEDGVTQKGKGEVGGVKRGWEGEGVMGKRREELKMTDEGKR